MYSRSSDPQNLSLPISKTPGAMLGRWLQAKASPSSDVGLSTAGPCWSHNILVARRFAGGIGHATSSLMPRGGSAPLRPRYAAPI